MNIQQFFAIFLLLFLTGAGSMRDKIEGSGTGVIVGHKRGANELDEIEDRQMVIEGEGTKAASSHPLRSKMKNEFGIGLNINEQHAESIAQSQ